MREEAEEKRKKRKVTKDVWETLRRDEEVMYECYGVLQDYFPIAQSCAELEHGDRCKAVNVVYTMATTLNLEWCTPSFACFLLDRFLSKRQMTVAKNRFVMLAMVCLNMAGKVADIDKGHCGSPGVTHMMADALSPLFEDTRTISRGLYQIETIVLRTLDHMINEPLIALACVAEATDWHRIDITAWKESILICDVFTTDERSTCYFQHQIARAVVLLVKSSEEVVDATADICSVLASFFDESCVEKFYGVKLRHQNDPMVRVIEEKLPFFKLNNVEQCCDHAVV
jgi:hypothetical protein